MGSVRPGIMMFVVSQLLSWSWRVYVAGSIEPTSVVAKLRSLLRRFPYWGEGHKLLAEAALAEKDIATAYAATHCFRLVGWRPTLNIFARKYLRQAHPLEGQWRHLLGRCFLASGDAEQALAHLRAAQISCPQSTAVTEDQVAALMALGRNEEASQVLRTIPEEHLSMSAKVAGDYLRNLTSGSVGAENKSR